MAYKLIDKHDRAKLSEGRNFGFSGGFARIHKDKKEVELIMPITACGDFYAEVVHSEYTGKAWSVYGFNYAKQNIFDLKKNVAYIVSAIMPYNRGDKHKDFDKEAAALNSNYQNIQKFLNWFEEKFKVKKKTRITKLADNRYLFTFDLFWTRGTYRISLFKFLSRASLFYDGKQNPVEFLDKSQNTDTYIWNMIKGKVHDMLDGFIPEQPMTDKDYCPHSIGIAGFVWPRALTAKKT